MRKTVFLSSTGGSYFFLGDIEARLGNRSAALNQYEHGQALIQTLAARDPENAGWQRDPNNTGWQRDICYSLWRVGDMHAEAGGAASALNAFRQALAIAKSLVEKDPANAGWQTDLAWSHYTFVRAGEEVKQHVAEGLAILRRLDAERKLTADQKRWIGMFEAALQAPAP